MHFSYDDAPEAARSGLLEENNGRKRRHGEREHYPIQVVALEPAGKMQDEDNDCDYVECVKSHIVLTPRSRSPQA
jgi:hypothetical protein